MVLATKKNCQRVLAASLRVVSAMTGNPPLLSSKSDKIQVHPEDNRLLIAAGPHSLWTIKLTNSATEINK